MDAKDVRLTPRPKRGDIVTFSYDNYSRLSLPVHPILQRVRSDLSWDHILSQHEKEGREGEEERSKLEAVSHRMVTFSAKPSKYWTTDKRRNMRLFFESFAKKMNFDPLVTAHWYTVERESILKAKVRFLFTFLLLSLFLR